MTTFFDRLRGYKTVTLNGVVLVGGLLQLFGINVLPSPEVAAEAFDGIVGGGAAILGGVNILLRAVTSSAIFNRD